MFTIYMEASLKSVQIFLLKLSNWKESNREEHQLKWHKHNWIWEDIHWRFTLVLYACRASTCLCRSLCWVWSTSCKKIITENQSSFLWAALVTSPCVLVKTLTVCWRIVLKNVPRPTTLYQVLKPAKGRGQSAQGNTVQFSASLQFVESYPSRMEAVARAGEGQGRFEYYSKRNLNK